MKSHIRFGSTADQPWLTVMGGNRTFLLTAKRYRLARRERRLGNDSIPVGLKVRQLVEVLQQQLPTYLFLIECPCVFRRHDIAADEVGSNLVAHVERDLGNVGQGQLPK